MSKLIPLFDQTNMSCACTPLENFDVSGWETILWAISGAGITADLYLWVRARWSFPMDIERGWPTSLAQPADLAVIPKIAGNLAIDHQLRAVRPPAPLLTLDVFQAAGSGQRFALRVWGSHDELHTADMWPGPFVLAEALSVGAGTTTTLQVPAYIGPVIAHAWSDATVAQSRIDLRTGFANPGNRTDILWKPGALNFSRELMLTAGGPTTIDCVNNDGTARLFDVALTPIARR